MELSNEPQCIELRTNYPSVYDGDDEIMKQIHDKITVHICKHSEQDVCYKREIVELAKAHGLMFDLNPGGGAFYGEIGRCQVSAISFKDDYTDLKNWLDNINNVSKEKIECGD